jgi:ABC-type glycerol-3-phosphate transport system substrate-binding protein
VDASLLEGVQITYLHPWSGETGRVMDLLIDEFNQSNQWGIHVITREPGSTGLLMQELNNDDPDLPEIDLTAVPIYELLHQDANMREVVDLNPYAASKTYGFTDEQREDFTPAFWDENLVGGKLYGVPAQESASLLFYNVTWAAELGYSSVPQTAAAFKLQTCAANASFRKDFDRSNDGIGGWIVSSEADTLFNWLFVQNALDLTAVPEKFNNLDTRTAFLYLYNLQANSCAWSSRLPEPYDYFATRQALAYSGTTQDIIPQIAAFERAENEDDWQVIAYPSEEGGIISSGLSYGVFKTDEKRQLASWLFIRWLSDPSNQARLLQTSGSLPLGTAVLDEMSAYEESYPEWKEALALLDNVETIPADANTGMVRMVLEDAGTFLFRTEFTADKVGELLAQLDQTIRELKEVEP